MALTQVAGGMIASGQSIASPTFTGTSTFAGGVANAYGFGVGTAVPSSGAGIAFPATQSASTDANTLDDYEEGTWTPTYTSGGVSTGVTYAVQIGRYTKVGNYVTIFLYFQLSSKGSATGNVEIAGLPFANVNISSFYVGGAMRLGNTTSLTGAVQFYCSPNSTSLVLESASSTKINNSNINNNTDFSLSWSYMV